jgi:hypothetical protein
MTLQEILSRLQNVKKNGNGCTALCPSHYDQQQSLSVKESDGKVLLKCFAGCDAQAIVSALGIDLKDLFAKPKQATNNFQQKKIVAVYDYADEHGEILYQNVRYEPKDFRQRKPNDKGGFDYSLNGARRVPYRLPELVEAVGRGADVWLCEGEKDADNLRTLGLAATSFKNWKSEFNAYLKTAHVCLIQDHDKAGLKQANDACKLLSGNVASLKTLDFYTGEPLPEKHGKDFSNWCENEKQNGLSLDEIAEKLCIFTDNADAWRPISASDADRREAESISDFEETENADAVKVGFTFGELQKIELPERVEIVRGLGRGENGLLNAVSHTGKSTLIRNLVLNLVLGKPFEPLTAGGLRYRVAVIDSEDTLTFLRSDLNKMQADFVEAEKKLIEENLFLICELSFGDEDLKLNKPEHFRRVIAAINDFGADFVFIDTVTSAFAIRNENDNSEVIENVMHPLKRFAKLTNTGVLTAHHIGKAKLENGETKEGIHRGRGASAFADKSRTIFNLDKDGDERVILSCPKLKGEKFADTIFKYDKDRRLFERQGETFVVSNYETLLDLFADGAKLKRKEIDEQLDGEMSEATITRNLKTARERGDLIKEKTLYSKNAHSLLSNNGTNAQTDAESQQNQAFQENAQMLTPYSNEHLSINENDTTERPFTAYNAFNATERKDSTSCWNCGLALERIKGGTTLFCPFGCESQKNVSGGEEK